jgi:hypothetical protein
VAAITVYPNAGLEETIEVRFKDEIWTFRPGVPQFIQQEQQAGVLAALQATGATLVSPACVVTPNVGASASYSYEVVAVNESGDTLPPTATAITTGNTTTLDATHYNTITWTSPAGATQMKIIRTVGGAAQGIIATVAASQVSLVDNGLVATAYTPSGSAVTTVGAAITNTEV